jgi:hypothetical protein
MVQIQCAEFVNGKMKTVETIPGMGQRGKINNGGGEFNYDIFDILQEPL